MKIPRLNFCDTPTAGPLAVMCLRRLFFVVLATLLSGGVPAQAAGAVDCPDPTQCPLPGAPPRMPALTIAYDGTLHRPGLETAWGFSCLVKGMQKTILFDAGGDGRILLANMKRLGLAPREIDAVVVSHLHPDHAGGLIPLLEKNRKLTAYLPASMPGPLMENVKRHGVKTVTVRNPEKICPDVFSTGEIGTDPPEQALALRTGRGAVVITGCAHPGIERVVRAAKEMIGGEVLLVVGGFHLEGSSRPQLETAVAGLKKLGVRYVAPGHCTGDAARRILKKAYGSGFIDVGVGKVIDTEALK